VRLKNTNEIYIYIYIYIYKENTHFFLSKRVCFQTSECLYKTIVLCAVASIHTHMAGRPDINEDHAPSGRSSLSHGQDIPLPFRELFHRSCSRFTRLSSFSLFFFFYRRQIDRQTNRQTGQLIYLSIDRSILLIRSLARTRGRKAAARHVSICM
jgi:hypothetical protein